MKRLLSLIFNLDPHTEIRQQAADRNWTLYGHDSVWMILDGMGKTIAVDDTPVKAFSKAVFNPNV